MARPVTTLVVFFVAMNLFAAMLMAAGVDTALGLDANVGGDEVLDETTNRDNVDSGAPSGDTLFGMYNVLTDQLGNVFGAIFPGLSMLQRAGVPTYVINFIGGLFSVMILFDVMSFLRGWNL